jgi:ribosomal protein S25
MSSSLDTDLGNGGIIIDCEDKGHFKKQKEIAKEIPLADVENIDRLGNEISITWKGVTETFVTEKAELAGTIYEKVTEALKEKTKMSEDKEAAKQKRNELAQTLNVSMGVVDSLFDVLRSLQGRVDWNRLEDHLKLSEENARSLAVQKIDTTNLEFTKLSLAVKGRLTEGIAKEADSILRSLYEDFSELAKNEFSEQIHPNYQDAKTAITAYYTLNDFILGAIGQRTSSSAPHAAI